MNFQEVILTLQNFWAGKGCILDQPYDSEVGAGTFHSSTLLRVLGPEPWNVAYVQPSRRPADGRYGENPNRLQHYYQFQVILKPSPVDVQELYLQSLKCLGIDPLDHDIRFVEDDWESPTLGASGLGWEIWLDGMEITQFTYFQMAGSMELHPVSAEITYGLERICMYLQGVDNVFDLKWNNEITYRDLHHQHEVEQSTYNFEQADVDMLLDIFNKYEAEAGRIIKDSLITPAYECCLKCSHIFNLLDARGAISVTERTGYIARIRHITRSCAEEYLKQRESMGFPMMKKVEHREPAEKTHVSESVTNDTTETLLFEIGTEEIPAGYIKPALKALSSLLLQKLTEARIEHGSARTFGTPKRLSIQIANVADKQQPLTTEIIGPPEKVGFDADGNPTVAAKKFAEKIGIPVESIKIKTTGKGRYLCGVKAERRMATKTLLESILPQVILKTPFPKTMRWADLPIHFARPIHTILALLGNSVIEFELGNIKSGSYTLGHRFMSPKRIEIADPGQYTDILHSAYVVSDVDERKKIVEQEIAKAASNEGGRFLPDEELVDTVTCLIEYPAVVLGRFDKDFLELPREVLITAMREHQKYFAVIDQKENLMPCFIAVNNTLAKDMDLVARGHERVLRARLADAQFFYRNDVKIPLENFVEKLKGVLFQADLGSVYEKVLRVRQLAEFLADAVDSASSPADKLPDLKQQVSRAAWLCKADLVSQVVGEFPKLQGIMGRIYAMASNEPDTVAYAIEEHYRPTYSGGALPHTTAGAILAIADKMDSICGCFSAGLVPTGASDPYALRRQGIGILLIMLDKGFSFSLRGLIEKSVNVFGERTGQDIQKTIDKVYAFLQNRMVHHLEEQGFSKDVIAAVTSVSVDNVPNIRNRVQALERLRAEPDFEPLAVAFKRVVNIIKKAGVYKAGEAVKDVDESLFQDEYESALYSAFNKIKNKVSEDMDKGRFDQALLEIASLRDSVDSFFDKVMVMAEDVKIRENRLALLGKIAELFGKFADFSKIST